MHVYDSVSPFIQLYVAWSGSNSLQCTSCQKWVHKKCSGIKGSMSKVAKSFICRGCLNPVTSASRTSVDIGASVLKRLNQLRCRLWCGPRNRGAPDPQKNGQFFERGHLPTNCEVYIEKSGTSKSCSVGVGSVVAFCCQYCSSLFCMWLQMLAWLQYRQDISWSRLTLVHW